MKNLLDYTLAELEEIVNPRFRAKQIYEWIYKKSANSFNEMLNLPKTMREELADEFYFEAVSCIKAEQSLDGSIKYLFELKDGFRIESVLLPMKEEMSDESGKITRHTRYTICVSSQVGCKMGCSFCLTAKGGLTRNLTAGEIVGQILWIKKANKIPYERRINIVYMGMGEPLDNLTNVSKAIKILMENDGLAISPRRQTVSTSGLASQIRKLGEMDLGVLLAISLHAVTDELRSKLMPINKAYNIESVMQAVREFPIDLRKRVMFEYLVIKDINDSVKDAKTLVKLLHGIKAKVNLIYFNSHEGSEYQRPESNDMFKFQEYLHSHGITCTIRQSKGLDISAACGQLKERNKNDENSGYGLEISKAVGGNLSRDITIRQANTQIDKIANNKNTTHDIANKTQKANAKMQANKLKSKVAIQKTDEKSVSKNSDFKQKSTNKKANFTNKSAVKSPLNSKQKRAKSK